MVVLTNQESGEAFEAITWGILDHFMGAAPFDWLEAFAAVKRRGDAALAQAEAATEGQP